MRRRAIRGCASKRCRIRATDGRTLLSALEKYEGQDITAIVIQQPNFFGVLEDVDALTDWARPAASSSLLSVNPTSLGMLKPPGDGHRQCRSERGSAGRQRSRRRHRRWRRSAARRAALLRRAVLRLHHYSHGARPSMPGRIVGRTVDHGWQGWLHADVAGTRAAHPTREGDVQHLHESGSARHRWRRSTCR